MTARRRVLYAAAAAAGVLAAGCAAVPPAPAVVISGRLAVVVAAHAGEPARQLAGSFELRGDAQRGQLDLVSPLGVTIARARWAPDRVELDAAEGPIAYASLDELTDRTFGEPMPVAALFDWLRGRPWGGSPSRATVGGFEQLGWQVDTTRFADGQLVARRPAPPEVTLRARLEAPP